MQIPITNTTTKYILTMSPPAVITLNGIDSFVAEYAIWISGMYNFDAIKPITVPVMIVGKSYKNLLKYKHI